MLKKQKASELKIEQEEQRTLELFTKVAKLAEDRELLEQRRLLNGIVEKYLQWAKEIDAHLQKHVSGCKLCPEHGYCVLCKKIKRECARKISFTEKR